MDHDPHILYTLSAVQILCMLDKLELLDVDKVANCICCVNFCLTLADIVGLQQPDGSFFGDQWGEIDTRFPLKCLV